MSQVGTVIRAKLQVAGHQVGSVRHESKLKIAVITVAAFLLWIAAFALFFQGFMWLLDFGGRAGGEFNFGDLLMARMLNILGLTLFFMLIFSNVLVCFATMYRSKEVVYLLQGPISYEQFFYARFFECVTFSSWSLAFLGSPLMLAYGMTTNASAMFYLAVCLFFIPYITVPAALGCAITILLVRVFPRLKTRTMVALGVLAVGLLGAYIYNTIRGTDVSEDTILPTFLNASARTQSPFLPSSWMADGVLAASRIRLDETLAALQGTAAAIGGGGEAADHAVSALMNGPLADTLYYFLLALSTAMMAMFCVGRLAQAQFYPGWSYLMGQDRQRIRPEGRGALAILERAMRRIPNPARALAVKDVKLFWRDPTQWSQFVIFFGIMAVYIANLRNSSRFYEQEFWRAWVACLNVGAVSLILASLTSRFVFPLVSLEGRRFWILGLAPLSFKQLVWQKFWLSVATTCAFSVGVSFLSAYMLQLRPEFFALTVYSVIITNFGLAGLAVGLGTLYPTFTEDNPARIVSGMGGTLNLLVSIAYITLIVAAQVVVLQWRNLELLGRPGLFPYAMGGAVLFITGLSIVCVFVPMKLGLRNLNRMEF